MALAQPQLVAAPAPAPVPAPMVPEPNPESVQLLMDMGFPRERCVEAIRNTTTLDQATEYLLNNPVAPPSVVQPIQVWSQTQYLDVFKRVTPTRSWINLGEVYANPLGKIHQKGFI